MIKLNHLFRKLSRICFCVAKKISPISYLYGLNHARASGLTYDSRDNVTDFYLIQWN